MITIFSFSRNASVSLPVESISGETGSRFLSEEKPKRELETTMRDWIGQFLVPDDGIGSK